MEQIKKGHCSICLTIRLSKYLTVPDLNNVTFLTKLEALVPEAEWKSYYRVCEECEERLNNAASFTVLCLEMERVRKNVKTEIDSEPIKTELDLYIKEEEPDSDTEQNVLNDQKSCCICFSKQCTKNLTEHLPNLENLIPSVEWKADFKICPECEERLNDAVGFLELCLETHCIRRKYKEKEIHVYQGGLANRNESTVVQMQEEEEESNALNETVKSKCFLCSNCFLVFDTKEDCKTHYETHIQQKVDLPVKKKVRPNRAEVKYKCGICQIDFSYKRELNKHNDIHVREAVKEQEEKLKKLEEKAERAKELPKEPSFLCGTCLKTFKLEEECNKHMETHNVNMIPKVEIDKTQNIDDILKNIKYTCEKCEKPFQKSRDVINHCAKEHRLDKAKVRPFLCPFCPKRITKLEYLKNHLNSHLDRRDFKCEKCKFGANTKIGLDAHVIRVHTNPWEWKFSCDECKLHFPIKKELRYHIQKYHTKFKYDPQNEYICYHCSRSFPIKIELPHHLRRKCSATKPKFECSTCKKKILDKKSFKMHVKKCGNVEIVTLKRPFQQVSAARALQTVKKPKKTKTKKVELEKPTTIDLEPGYIQVTTISEAELFEMSDFA